ncbi:hypothetical protein VTH82DRAFT_7065 [Thermothelomyces myriococcoides]
MPALLHFGARKHMQLENHQGREAELVVPTSAALSQVAPPNPDRCRTLSDRGGEPRSLRSDICHDHDQKDPQSPIPVLRSGPTTGGTQILTTPTPPPQTREQNACVGVGKVDGTGSGLQLRLATPKITVDRNANKMLRTLITRQRKFVR